MALIKENNLDQEKVARMKIDYWLKIIINLKIKSMNKCY